MQPGRFVSGLYSSGYGEPLLCNPEMVIPSLFLLTSFFVSQAHESPDSKMYRITGQPCVAQTFTHSQTLTVDFHNERKGHLNNELTQSQGKSNCFRLAA